MIFKSVAKLCTMLGLVASVSFMSVSQAQDLPLQGVKLDVGVAPTAPFCYCRCFFTRDYWH